MNNKITKVAPSLPALSGGFGDFTTLQDDADLVLEAYERISDARRELEKRRRGDRPPDSDVAELGSHEQAALLRARAMLVRVEVADRYDIGPDGARVLRQAVIAQRLTLTLGSATFKTAPSDPACFAVMLLEHVRDARPDYLALETCCRRIEKRREKFEGSINAWLAELELSDGLWTERRHAIDEVEERSRETSAAIAQAWPRFRVEHAEMFVRNAQRDYDQQQALVVEKQMTARGIHSQVASSTQVLARCRQDLDQAIAKLATAKAALREGDDENADA